MLQLELADTLTRLPDIPDGYADLLITDPPYASMEKHRARGTTTRLKQSKSSSNRWFSVINYDTFPVLMREFFRILKQNTHLYMFCDSSTLLWAQVAGVDAGFTFHKPLIWVKHRIGMGYHYRAQYEFILFFEKGRRALKSRSISDVLHGRSIRGKYPTEKPVEVLVPLVHQSSLAGEIVFDPFMGSGSTGEAALRLGRSFHGVDVAGLAYQTAQERLAPLRLELPRRRVIQRQSPG